MAIMDCNECGGKVSTTAKACPHCGGVVPDDPQIERIKTILAWLAILAILVFVITKVN